MNNRTVKYFFQFETSPKKLLKQWSILRCFIYNLNLMYNLHVYATHKSEVHYETTKSFCPYTYKSIASK